MSLYIGIGL